MAVYKLVCEIEYPDTPEGLSAGMSAIGELNADRETSVSGSMNLHRCGHDENPTAVCEPYIVNDSWGMESNYD